MDNILLVGKLGNCVYNEPKTLYIKSIKWKYFWKFVENFFHWKSSLEPSMLQDNFSCFKSFIVAQDIIPWWGMYAQYACAYMYGWIAG